MRKLEILLVCDMGIWYKLPINYQSNYSVCYHSDYQFGSYAFVDSPIDYQKRLPFGSLFSFLTILQKSLLSAQSVLLPLYSFTS